MESKLEVVGKRAVLSSPTLRIEVMGDKNTLVGTTTEDSNVLLEKVLEVVKEVNKTSDIYRAVEELYGSGALMKIEDYLNG